MVGEPKFRQEDIDSMKQPSDRVIRIIRIDMSGEQHGSCTASVAVLECSWRRIEEGLPRNVQCWTITN